MLTFNETGIIIPDTEEVFNQLKVLFQNTYGDQIVDTSPTSINGMLLMQITNLIVQNNSELIALFNNFYLNTAQGIFVDYIGSCYNIERIPGTYSIVNLQVLGSANAEIPVGFQVSDNFNNIFTTQQQYILDNTGQAIIKVVSEVVGSYLPLPNTLNQILSIAQGIDSVNNSGVGDTIGKEPETDSNYRVRIFNSVFGNQSGTISAIQGAISQISSDFIIIENFFNVPRTLDGIIIPANTLWISSNEGADNDIALAIYNSKPIGVGMMGNVEISIGGYSIKFNRPNLVPINIECTIQYSFEQITNFDSLAKTIILNSMITYAKIGQPLYASNFINDLIDNGILNIVNLTLNGDTQLDSAITELFTVYPENIKIIIIP